MGAKRPYFLRLSRSAQASRCNESPNCSNTAPTKTDRIYVYSYVASKGHRNYGDDASVLYKEAYMVSLIWIKFGFYEDLHILHVKYYTANANTLGGLGSPRVVGHAKGEESRLPFRQLIHERDIPRTFTIGLGKAWG